MSASGGYILYPIQRDSEELLSEAYQMIKDKAPDWVENNNNLDVWILQAVASQASDLLGLARDVPESIFQYYGSKLLGYPPLLATSAQVDSTWTMKDNLGYTVPAGTQVSIRDTAGIEHGFETRGDIAIPAGSTATAAGAVTLYSVETGATLTGLGGAGYQATLIDTLNFVASVVLTEFSSGGQDAELVSQYSERLARKMQQLSQRPVLASDFSLAALDVPGVYRTLTLDGYNSSNQTFNNERYVGIAAVDELGQPVSAQIKSQLQTFLDSQREINFVVNVFDPTITTVNVTFNVKCLHGYTAAAVDAAAEQRVRDYLSPANWGKDPAFIEPGAASQTWVPTPNVIYNKMIQVLATTDGVNYVISMTMGAPTLGTTDIVLPGAAPLTTPGTINGTATP